ncbi:MAG: TIGR03618 family F420-dependent PPOX class oxidoreductase [Gaiellales bacterium]
MPRGPLPPELERFLAAPRPAVVSTLTADGSPVTTPTWYEWTGAHLVLVMDRNGRRVGNLRRDPRVGLTVLDDDWYRHLSLLGRTIEIRDDPDLADVDRLAERYWGHAYEPRDWKSVTVTVEVERWHTYGSPGESAPP